MSKIPIAHPPWNAWFVMLSLLIIGSILSCSSAKQETESALPPQPVTPPASTPQPTLSSDAKMIYTLVDRSTSYERLTKQALERLVEVLPRVLRPGDQLRVAWIDSQSGDPDRTFVRDDVRQVECAASPAEPTPPQSGTTMEWQQYWKELEGWKKQVDQLKNDCLGIQDKAVREFLDRNEPRIKDNENTVFFDDVGTRIYEAIYEVSSYFTSFNDPGNAVSRKLLIFSDMQESRFDIRNEVPIDLSGVDVIVAMFYSSDLGAREKSKDEWTRLFQNAGAESVEFLVVDASTVEKVAELILR